MASANRQIRYQLTLPPEHFGAAAALYDDAFGAKFALAVPDRDRRVDLLEKCLMGDHAVVALEGERLVGIAGFHSPAGSLTGGIVLSSLIAHLGLLRAVRAALVFGFYERRPDAGELVMDGIAVAEDCRGLGIGTRLLQEVAAHGRAERYEHVRLDVVDTNPAARRLYERNGFVAVNTETFPYLRWLFGFGASTEMRLDLGQGDLVAARTSP